MRLHSLIAAIFGTLAAAFATAMTVVPSFAIDVGYDHQTSLYLDRAAIVLATDASHQPSMASFTKTVRGHDLWQGDGFVFGRSEPRL